MPVFAILLRVLLCLGLLLNGAGYAVAATQMQMQHLAAVSEARQAAAAAVDQDASVQPCHEVSDAVQAAADPPAPPIAGAGEDHPQPELPTPGCCQSTGCASMCAPQAAAAMPDLSAGHRIVNHASGVRPLRAGHPEPALPHLIRPPIG